MRVREESRAASRTHGARARPSLSDKSIMAWAVGAAAMPEPFIALYCGAPLVKRAIKSSGRRVDADADAEG